MRDTDYLKDVLAQWLMKDRPPMGMPEAIATIGAYITFTILFVVILERFPIGMFCP